MKKIQRKEQSGRSMVEMLGVLAIIGVLSVGGVAGYRYAMGRGMLNKMLYVSDLFAFSVQETRYDYENKKTPYDETDRESLRYFCNHYLGGCDVIEARSMCGGRSCYTLAIAEYDGLEFTIKRNSSHRSISIEFFLNTHRSDICADYFFTLSNIFPKDDIEYEIYMNDIYDSSQFNTLIGSCSYKGFNGLPGGYGFHLPWEPWDEG